MQLGVVRFEVPQQRLNRHRRGDLCLLDETLHIVNVQRGHRRQQVGAIDRRQPIPRLQARDGNACPLHRHVTRETFPLIERFALAHEQKRGLRHRSQVAARAHRALLTNNWCDASVQHLHQCQGNLRSAAGIPMRVDVDPPCQRRTDVLDRRRLANPRRVVVNQIFLKLLHLVIVEHGLRKLANACVRAIHDFFPGKLLLQHGAADLDPLQGLGS